MSHCPHMAERFEGWDHPPEYAACNDCTSVAFKPPGEGDTNACNVCHKRLPKYASSKTCGRCQRARWQQRNLTDSFAQARLSPYNY